VAAGKGESDLGLGMILFIPFVLTGSVWSGLIGLNFFKPKPNQTGWFFYFLIGFFYRFSFSINFFLVFSVSRFF